MYERRGPQFLYVNKKDYDSFNNLIDEKSSPVHGLERKNIFLLAMAIGLSENSYCELSGKKETYIRSEYLNKRDQALIDAVAVYRTGNLEVLRDMKKVFSIAENYAAGGLKLLMERVFEGEMGTFTKRLESDLRSILKNELGGVESNYESE